MTENTKVGGGDMQKANWFGYLFGGIGASGSENSSTKEQAAYRADAGVTTRAVEGVLSARTEPGRGQNLIASTAVTTM